MSEKIVGTCEWFSAKLGYGFLRVEGQKDMFVHFSDIVMPEGGFKTLKKDQQVTFEVGKTLSNEPKAINVVIINE